MKKTFIALLLFIIIGFTFQDSYSQTVRYTYTRPSWTIGFGPVWNLATNDAYGRANYSETSTILRDNYGMRWGWGGYLFGKYGPGKKKNDRIFLGVDYKGMTNSDFEGSDANKTHYDFITIDAGYEFLFYGTYKFRSYYGAGLTGNIIKGEYTPLFPNDVNKALTFESTFRLGFELKAGLEFIFNSRKRNFGLNVGAKYNLTNLFNDDNATASLGQTQNLNLNDGKDSRAGFKRYIGIVSIDVGLNIYPDVKRVVRK
ncbi:MAG: hypothetical protein ABI462_06855 [Ignavibacteria bacterium]